MRTTSYKPRKAAAYDIKLIKHIFKYEKRIELELDILIILFSTYLFVSIIFAQFLN